MNIVIISGSHRQNSQSLKVSNWLAEHLKTKSAKSEIIDLSGNPIPFWSEEAWNAESDLAKEMSPYLEKIEKADGLILVSPEWHGMVPSGLKNFLLYVSSQHAAHNPSLLVGVSASRGGTYPIAELRMSGYKNNRMVYIPDHLIVSNCENVMNDPALDSGEKADQYIKNRADYSLNVLLAYAKALKTMRDEHDLLSSDYPFGM
tara:strand:- start:3653 stop:4261 length:609 start_codon:yes stop_codon:yes gene_type:complete